MRPRLLDDPGLWLLCHLRPPWDRRRDRVATCTVCAHPGRQVYTSWILSRSMRKRWGRALATRESMLCQACGCNDRVRSMVGVLLELYGEGATTLRELVREEGFRSLEIAEINSIGRAHAMLAEVPHLTYVEYPEEDVQALSWADERFDLVLTSETLEHVPDPRRGLRETLRVLRPGGRHVFTVPVDPELAVTRSADGLPPEYHGRGGGPFSLISRHADMEVHTYYGDDLSEVVAEQGFTVETRGSGSDLVVIATRPT